MAAALAVGGQFVAMLFCQLGRAHSLREICYGLSTCEGKLSHLGIDEAPKRSSLAYANEHRSWELYQKLFFLLLERCRKAGPFKKKFRLQNLKIKTFVGTSPSAVKIQVWTALIAILILRYLKLKSQFSWSLSNLVALLRMNRSPIETFGLG